MVGQDANGDKSTIQFLLFLATPEEYARRMDLDPAVLEKLRSPSPAIAVTP